ncbi:hypothetical protein XELAEV_18004936mg [Xenopus laevis]|uniref:Receptor ligand binding region domain-containing protein n=1 Tax=Xenopus laevis TaxID=8355 RepID=A0A974DX50_XENLA|nr:hypothetical protein XELAEV_18004936mg [Xenopus laevis]
MNKIPGHFFNLTLGFDIYDSCGNELKAVRSVLQILSGTREPVPNYSCRKKQNIAGFIGDLNSRTTVPIAQILSVYGYSQISYGSTDPSLSDRAAFPYFFRTVQNDHRHFFALSKLIKHFGWTWVGIVTSDDDTGEREHQLLSQYFSSDNICVEVTIKFAIKPTSDYMLDNESIEMFLKSSANIIVLCGTVEYKIIMKLYQLLEYTEYSDKTLVLTPIWASQSHSISFLEYLLHGSLIFVPHFLDPVNMYRLRFKQFANDRHPSKYPEDVLLKQIWAETCGQDGHKCPREQQLTGLKNFDNTFHLPGVYLAVLTMTHGLQILLNEQSKKKNGKGNKYQYQLHHYLKRVTLTDTENQASYFDETGEFVTELVIINLHKDHRPYLSGTPVGKYTPWAPPDHKLNITAEAIRWNTLDKKVT